MISSNRDDYDPKKKVRLLFPVRFEGKTYPANKFYALDDLPDYAFTNGKVCQDVDPEVEAEKTPPSEQKTPPSEQITTLSPPNQPTLLSPPTQPKP